MSLIGLLFVPPLVLGIAFFVFHATITWKEFLLTCALGIGLVFGGYQLAKWGALQSTEHLNGRVTGKPSGTEHCCHCRTVCDARDKKGNCTSSHEECDHFHDYWWSIDTTVGRIDVEDCSGSNSPPSAWVSARVGEPASVNHTYTNYLKADENNVLVHKNLSQYVSRVPKYPEVYGYYRVDPVISDGAPVPNGWTEAVRELNADLGASNQVDVTILLTNVREPAYAQAVESKWMYGPKNSFTVILGTDGQKVTWARGMTFSKVERLKMLVREELRDLPVQGDEVPNKVRSLVKKNFKRTAMADYEYLARSMEPPFWWLIGLYIFAFLASAGLVYWAHTKDIFGDEGFGGQNPFGRRSGSPFNPPFRSHNPFKRSTTNPFGRRW